LITFQKNGGTAVFYRKLLLGVVDERSPLDLVGSNLDLVAHATGFDYDRASPLTVEDIRHWQAGQSGGTEGYCA
jgi:hypothetical protein